MILNTIANDRDIQFFISKPFIQKVCTNKCHPSFPEDSMFD